MDGIESQGMVPGTFVKIVNVLLLLSAERANCCIFSKYRWLLYLESEKES